MEPAAAADVLRRTLTDPKRPITVADASVASGLAARDAEAGLTWLTSEYRGHLRVTEDGDLVHLFPHGFTKPWETQETLARVLSRFGAALVGAGRFIVRAWLLIVMVSYALLFAALLIGMTLARQGSSDRDDGPGVSILGALFRMIAEAVFWTFHPFSPLYIERRWTDAEVHRRARERPEEKVAFYEKVNRFVFGPTVPKEDPHAARAAILREIRAQRGRIGLADVMRVTGLPRDQADPLMARLMLDHDGTVDVSEGGGIVYTFEALRRTADEEPRVHGDAKSARPPAAWDRLPKLPPLTGNPAGSNVLVALLNGFNLLASAWAIQNHLTLSNLALLFDPERPRVLPDDGLPLVLGAIPFVFSIVLFALPILRALFRSRQQKHIDEEHARLAVLREVVTRSSRKEPIADETLRAAVRVATGEEPTSKDITRRVVELGGDVDVGPQGEVRYRFAELEAEAEALEEERERASEREARLGKVVFASDQ
ncbi:MAG: hypothetical protein BGO98_49100 [Myxococcales bacterium 68-20]|nr:hypothetical protein [Myxococcales bacterium]OJY29782.1 MAG: hypothetical protein BGO98_49100 [Myxococcales bacterium 68-20]